MLSNGRAAYGFETRAEIFGQRQGSEATRETLLGRHFVVYGDCRRIGGLRIGTPDEIEGKALKGIFR